MDQQMETGTKPLPSLARMHLLFFGIVALGQFIALAASHAFAGTARTVGVITGIIVSGLTMLVLLLAALLEIFNTSAIDGVTRPGWSRAMGAVSLLGTFALMISTIYQPGIPVFLNSVALVFVLLHVCSHMSRRPTTREPASR